jgi:signal transduction histidine kinase
MTQQQCSAFGWGDVLHPDDAERTIAAWKECVRNEGTWDIEHRYRGVDGQYHPILARGVPVRDERGKIIYWAGINLDISRLKRTETELKEAKAQAELYLDLMGHDISNMHQIIMGQLELAKDILDSDRKLDAVDRELIDTSLATLERSSKLIDNVRNLQRLRSGEFKEEVIDLDGLLADVIKEFDDLLPGEPIIFVRAGPHPVKANKLLYDVFTNLIGNAIKHSNGNNVNIVIDLKKIRENGDDHYRVIVEDNGPGIPDDLKNKIFNRLQRGDTKARGMGLGLYLVKSLVDSFNGKVWVEDRVRGDHRKGSRFVVVLPAIAN